MQSVTRDVITDLWPLYTAGEASPDTRALIESFLQDDPEFARTIHQLERESLPRPDVPVLAPNEELRTLARLRHRGSRSSTSCKRRVARGSERWPHSRWMWVRSSPTRGLSARGAATATFGQR